MRICSVSFYFLCLESVVVGCLEIACLDMSVGDIVGVCVCVCVRVAWESIGFVIIFVSEIKNMPCVGRCVGELF